MPTSSASEESVVLPENGHSKSDECKDQEEVPPRVRVSVFRRMMRSVRTKAYSIGVICIHCVVQVGYPQTLSGNSESRIFTACLPHEILWCHAHCQVLDYQMTSASVRSSVRLDWARHVSVYLHCACHCRWIIIRNLDVVLASTQYNRGGE